MFKRCCDWLISTLFWFAGLSLIIWLFMLELELFDYVRRLLRS